MTCSVQMNKIKEKQLLYKPRLLYNINQRTILEGKK